MCAEKLMLMPIAGQEGRRAQRQPRRTSAASSLKLISIHERIEQCWPRAVEMTDIFEYPTIRALDKFIETKIVWK